MFDIMVLGDIYMTKLYRQSIIIQPGPDGLPLAFRWRDWWYQVEECIPVRESFDRYWVTMYLPRYRCETRQGMTCDLMKDGDKWLLERVWD